MNIHEAPSESKAGRDIRSGFISKLLQIPSGRPASKSAFLQPVAFTLSKIHLINPQQQNSELHWSMCTDAGGQVSTVQTRYRHVGHDSANSTFMQIVLILCSVIKNYKLCLLIDATVPNEQNKQRNSASTKTWKLNKLNVGHQKPELCPWWLENSKPSKRLENLQEFPDQQCLRGAVDCTHC